VVAVAAVVAAVVVVVAAAVVVVGCSSKYAHNLVRHDQLHMGWGGAVGWLVGGGGVDKGTRRRGPGGGVLPMRFPTLASPTALSRCACVTSFSFPPPHK
jgi:hypothetical protein